MSSAESSSSSDMAGQDEGTVRLELKDVNMRGQDRVSMKDFELLRVLGTGAYGKVFLTRKVTGPDKGKLYALKQLKKASIVHKAKTTEHTITERQVLEAIRDSPFLVTLHYAFQTDSKLNLILDFVNGGEMFTHLNQRDRFEEQEARVYIGEVVLALETLHQLGIIYRDIKLENILLDSKGHIVLTDFGLSKEFMPNDTSKRTYSFCGTIEYMAPEIIRSSTGHDFTVDWWSLGVLAFELMTGTSPFSSENPDENTQSEVSKRILKIEPRIPDFLSSDMKDFIRRLMIKDPSKRLGARGVKEIKRHRFFKGLNWEDLAQKRIPAPFTPKIKDDLDVSNFSEDFTNMPPTESPAIAPDMGNKLFKGYSFVAPSIIFSENSISSSLLAPSKALQPDESVFPSLFKNSPFFQQYDLDLRIPALGDGSFSICRKCTHKRSGATYAVKIISNRKSSCRQELQNLSRCQGHPNIVTLHEVFTDEIHTYMVMELLEGGELLSRIKQRKFFTETEAIDIMNKLVRAVDFMHSKGVVHRDLKPENLIFESKKEGAEIKVVDFGFATLLPESQTLMTPCFTLPYSAPEVLSQLRTYNNSGSGGGGGGGGASVAGYDASCDLWSLGVILYTMLSGRAPFQSQREEQCADSIMKKIRGGDFVLTGPEWQAVSHGAKDLIQGLLTVEPSKRLGMPELVRHPWLQRAAPVAPTPLRTPGVLSSFSATVNSQLNTTYEAFNLATRQGLRLLDVSSAPLAKRRKQKKNSVDHRSSSTDSSNSGSSSSGAGGGGVVTRSSPLTHSSPSPVARSPARTFSNTSSGSGSGASAGFVPSRYSPYQRTLELGVSPLATTSPHEAFVINETSLAASVEVTDSQDSDVMMAVFPSASSSLDTPTILSSTPSPLPPSTPQRGTKRKLDMRSEDEEVEEVEDDEDEDDEDDDCVITGSSNLFRPQQAAPGSGRGGSDNNNKRVKVIRNSTNTIVID
ncbi:ribosomal protein S6 kinase alpha-5-like [Babylonia areolata]|uniref:ribosomal protein S6 kinase alpha-5-like n=1 Tax=Babylonia areolata TaxID=304850 RepID=UPI003FD1967B